MLSPAALEKRSALPLDEHEVLRKCRNPAIAQLMRYAAVGLSATGIYLIGIRILLKFTQMSVPVAAMTSFASVVAMNYVLHYSWTFRSNRAHSIAVPRFVVMAVGAMIVNGLVVAIGTRWPLLPQTAVFLVGVGLVVVWNYLLARFWVFGDGSHRQVCAPVEALTTLDGSPDERHY